MALRQFSARGLAGVVVAGLLVAGCTPAPGTSPSVPPSSAAPTQASPTSSPTPTRTESPEEQKQREAFEAAEKAYRANWAESGRLAMAGGADKPTRILKETSTGQYLADSMLNLQTIKEKKLRASGPGKIAWVRRGGYSPTQLTLKACEDYRDAILTERDGSVFTPTGTRVYDQTITVMRSGGSWKLSDQDTDEVKQC